MQYALNCRLVLLLLIFLSAPVLAQDTGGEKEKPAGQPGTRAELWKEMKIEKQQSSQPLKLGWMERLFVNGEKGKFNLSHGGIYPVIGTVTSGSGPSFGARFDALNLGGLPLDLSIMGEGSTRRYQEYSAEIGELGRRETTFVLQPDSRRLVGQFDQGPREKQPGGVLYLDFTFDHFPQEDFYGLGQASLRSNVSDYLYQAASVEAVAGFQFNRWLGWSIRGGLLRLDLQPGTDEGHPDLNAVFGPAAIPGVAVQPDFLHFETALLADYRDKPGNAHRGGMFGILTARYDDRGGRQFGFSRVAFETRQYLPWWSDYRTFALRFLTSFDRPSDGAEVPFYLMESLGGSGSIRGFPEYRFRDRNLLLMSAEYRWRVAEFLQMALFYDTGKVFAHSADFDFSGLEKGFGGGFRILRGDTVFLRLELGHSREGNMVHLRLGPSF